MIAVNGTYKNGTVYLEKKVKSKKALKVIVTFLEEDILLDKNRLTLKDFSFYKSREKLKKYKGSISETIIEERKTGL
jgi:hypothetical protein